MTNALAYFVAELITSVRSFIVPESGHYLTVKVASFISDENLRKFFFAMKFFAAASTITDHCASETVFTTLHFLHILIALELK
jgi:hypothetical protein